MAHCAGSGHGGTGRGEGWLGSERAELVSEQVYQADVVIAGGGLAGMVAAYELLDLGKSVILLERDSEEKFGGLAKESFGGVMLIDRKSVV